TVWAEEQSTGRGRRGAVWLSGPGEGLTFSVILRPGMPRALWPRLALVSGLAIVRVLEGQGLAAELKWPNDVMVKDRKICGILVEAFDDAVIVGVGINVNEAVFPESIVDIATSMRAELGRNFVLSELLENCIEELLHHSRLAEQDFSFIAEAMRERCALTGRLVRIVSAGASIVGMVRGISNQGELQLESEGRLLSFLQADQVRLI
ncbi:MAG: biotin--[acetyl-CoA-carboxylase] ligase, partial [Verrucomicrobia bacterium]|nr:biotin--[acetyl-CoA-carboxylase] ligase [Verrucomicrobiota bacterium]